MCFFISLLVLERPVTWSSLLRDLISPLSVAKAWLDQFFQALYCWALCERSLDRGSSLYPFKYVFVPTCKGESEIRSNNKPVLEGNKAPSLQYVFGYVVMCVCVQPCIKGQYPNFDCNGESTHVEKRIWGHASPECSCQGLRAGI